MTLPPCHYGFQVYTRKLNFHERSLMAIKNGWKQKYYIDDYDHEDFDEYNVPRRAISLLWNQRSVDTFLGLPFNIASYGLLLTMLADEVNMMPDMLIGNLGDTHLYQNHIEQAKEQIERKPYELPTVKIQDGIYSTMPNDIILENYKSHPAIKAPLSN
jgi:thymidylate synthase